MKKISRGTDQSKAMWKTAVDWNRLTTKKKKKKKQGYGAGAGAPEP